MKTIRNLVLVLCLSIGLLSCGHDDTSSEKADFKVAADEIVNEFIDDAEAANAKYNDKIIEVSGPVMELNKENGTVTGIKLSNDEFNIVNCTFQYPVSSDQLQGDQVTIKGVCSGFLGDASSMLPGGTVEIKRAALVTP